MRSLKIIKTLKIEIPAKMGVHLHGVIVDIFQVLSGCSRLFLMLCCSRPSSYNSKNITDQVHTSGDHGFAEPWLSTPLATRMLKPFFLNAFADLVNGLLGCLASHCAATSRKAMGQFDLPVHVCTSCTTLDSGATSCTVIKKLKIIKSFPPLGSSVSHETFPRSAGGVGGNSKQQTAHTFFNIPPQSRGQISFTEAFHFLFKHTFH